MPLTALARIVYCPGPDVLEGAVLLLVAGRAFDGPKRSGYRILRVEQSDGGKRHWQLNPANWGNR